jgi:inhibitor of cysteine peptidase
MTTDRRILLIGAGVLVLAAIIGTVFFLNSGLFREPAPRVYTSAATTIEARTGERFTIELDGNRTTGYQWQLGTPLEPSLLVLVASEYLPEDRSKIGAGGRETMTFRAVGRGTATINLVYVRPWETNVPPTKTSAFTVVIQ